jgi:hypothetical protein
MNEGNHYDCVCMFIDSHEVSFHAHSWDAHQNSAWF